MRGNGFRQRGMFRLDIRMEFFTVRVGSHWKRLPRVSVDASILEVFKAKLGGTLRDLV